ncbi:MAG TPA: hypothetical protein VGE72_18710 [Azospirillum sp.]
MSSAETTREPSTPEFEALIHHIQESRGLDFRGYKRASLRRRIRPLPPLYETRQARGQGIAASG